MAADKTVKHSFLLSEEEDRQLRAHAGPERGAISTLLRQLIEDAVTGKSTRAIGQHLPEGAYLVRFNARTVSDLQELAEQLNLDVAGLIQLWITESLPRLRERVLGDDAGGQ
jgi:hypothetical protein